MENQQAPSRYKPLQTKEAWDKLIDASENLKLQRSLSDAQAERVTEAIEVLRIIQTSPRRKKYKRFLYDALRVSGPWGVLLCAVGLGQVKAVDMKNCDRVSFIRQIEINKDHTDINHPILQSLAISSQIPTSLDDVLADVQSLPQSIVKRPRKRKGRETPQGRLQNNEEASPAVSTSPTNTPPPNETQSGPISTPKISLNNQSFTRHQEHEVLENASLQGIANVFDEYMCGAIRRDTVRSGGTPCLKAAITMDFPLQGLVDCLMSLAIHPSKVEYLAMALFKVQLGSVGHVRYVTLTAGGRLTPNPEITLKGVSEEAIIRVFGPEIHEAIIASGMRKKELEEGNDVTEGVSMILTSSSDEGAVINLSLGVKGGVQIRKKLYT